MEARVKATTEALSKPGTPLAGEQIDWTECGDGLECGFVEVPADYRDPGAGSIRIAVNVHRATSQRERIGYLFVNPGGPGESGVDMVHEISSWFPNEVLERFDIIGFDPRGVGLSEPAFACGGPGEQLALLESIDGAINTPNEIAVGEAAAILCIQSMGPIGGLLHSQYVANDMDEIRKVLGADQISYLGFSYESTLGVWYATLFPESVRVMVVDGADNPVDTATTQQERVDEALEEIAPFEASLREVLAACADSRCPIYNNGDPVAYYYEASKRLDLVNAAANDHPLAGVFGVISALYSEATWPDLWWGLYELLEFNDPSILLEYASIQLGPEPGLASFTGHVNCLDGWVLPPEVDRATLLEDTVVIESAIKRRFPLLT